MYGVSNVSRPDKNTAIYLEYNVYSIDYYIIGAQSHIHMGQKVVLFKYGQISNISRTKPKTLMILVSSCSKPGF